MNRAAAAAVGGWVELDRATGTYTSLDITSLADKRYYMILNSGLSWSSGQNSQIRFNNDSGSNYATRYSRDGAADGTETSGVRTVDYVGTGTENQIFAVNYIANYATKEKLGIAHSVIQKTAGATTAPSRDEIVYKWANTSNAINQISYTSSTGHGSGSEVVVLGWDPADSHTNNFWEELASVDLSGGAADTISSGTITAKKYLWVQCFVEQTVDTVNAFTRFNSDSGSNYARRTSNDGAADATSTSATEMAMSPSGGNKFINLFIINNQSNEKLVIYHSVTDGATAGAGTAPQRGEGVFKWANTSNQITQIDISNDAAGDFGTNTIIKVWGAN